MSREFDIIVAGAGMVGACSALSLARQGFRIALLDPVEANTEALPFDADYDLRVSAISPVSQQILSELGVWQNLDQRRLCAYQQMTIWHHHGDARIHFDCVELAREQLGVIVENRQILQALHRGCAAQPNIEWFCPDSICELLENSEQGLSVKLSSGVKLQADLLIAADGRASSVRELAGFEVTSASYEQKAIVANVSTKLPHRLTAWQRFLNTGPLAFLPLANGDSSIVWSADTERADELMSLDDKAFGQAISDAMQYQLGEVFNISERRSFPLGWHSCTQWLIDRVLLIGDAAHGVHPLAGQGVNLGFSDVALLSQRLSGLDAVFNYRQLRRFERQRKSETAIATHAFSALKSIYGTDNDVMNKLRDLGMRGLQSNPAARRLVMQQALRNLA